MAGSSAGGVVQRPQKPDHNAAGLDLSLVARPGARSPRAGCRRRRAVRRGRLASVAPACAYASSEIPDFTPAPASTATSRPLAISFLTASGSSATRVSPTAASFTITRRKTFPPSRSGSHGSTAHRGPVADGFAQLRRELPAGCKVEVSAPSITTTLPEHWLSPEAAPMRRYCLNKTDVDT